MILKKWESLPENMKSREVYEYYLALKKKTAMLFFKRLADIVISLVLLILLLPLFLILSLMIKIDSRGPVFYRQERITQYGKKFRIHKFRTMRVDADKGSLVTLSDDERITGVGRLIRKCRLDELSQLIDVLFGSMTLVGTRPEVARYVEEYTPEMMATLLLPAGITSEASVYYKDEAEMLDGAEDADLVYVRDILPKKMAHNLNGLKKCGFIYDMRVVFMTVLCMFGKKYGDAAVTASPSKTAVGATKDE